MDPLEEEQQREGVLGSCPQVEVEVGGWKYPCLLDISSQVTLFSEEYYQWWLGDRPMQNPAVLEWLNPCTANGLQISFIGYAVMDFIIGGVQATLVLPGETQSRSQEYHCGGGRVPLRIMNVHPFPIELPRRHPLATIAGIDPSQVQGGRNIVLHTPSPGEVVIDFPTTQAPAGAGSPLDLPEVEGLTPDQQQRFRELIH
ncbi:hypothetical protein SKAU_G00412840 [Synaphobranchus kaupii]|uniref:Uncharacterized protein n=1 Tax=Synaphobranchus kaupii TaxID=118154 RepID=A0A9Q1E837_SYNKA|nr:hypothetical protein SKAU_G00412840 [Synaphobranchus kaupii]